MKFGSILTLSLTAFIMAPVAAQQEARQPEALQEQAYPDDVKVNIVERFGEDACPESTADEIVVCTVYDEGDRYRIPKLLRNDPNDPANQSWNERATSLRTLGAEGTNSCTPVGAGGFAGCLNELIGNAYAERENAPNVQAGQLIEEERKKRLGLIDAEAEDVERRIVEFEKARAEKEAAEAAAAQKQNEEDAILNEKLPELIPPEQTPSPDDQAADEG